MRRLLDEATVEAGPLAANCRMNRGRGLEAYARELRLDIVARRPGRWLDVGCGEGRALLEAESLLPETELVGIDLVDHFRAHPVRVRFLVGPVREVEPGGPFDLITAVHALHYVGDKLGTLERLRRWLTPEGTLVAHLDLAQVLVGERPGSRRVLGWLRSRGYAWDARRHQISVNGPGADTTAPWRWEGAIEAGPNYTGQPAVASVYAPA